RWFRCLRSLRATSSRTAQRLARPPAYRRTSKTLRGSRTRCSQAPQASEPTRISGPGECTKKNSARCRKVIPQFRFAATVSFLFLPRSHLNWLACRTGETLLERHESLHLRYTALLMLGITTLDNQWMGHPRSIAAALLESEGHRAIVDPGPGS